MIQCPTLDTLDQTCETVTDQPPQHDPNVQKQKQAIKIQPSTEVYNSQYNIVRFGDHGCILQSPHSTDLDGFGKITFASGASYIGEWKKANRSGFGRYVSAEGDTYTGDWADDQRNGFGIELYSNNYLYQGWFKGDQKTGYGQMNYNDGSIYDGIWANNEQKVGHMRFTNTKDSSFSNWQGGNRSGHGRITTTSGDIVRGMWLNGIVIGRAMRQQDKQIYFGDFPDMKATGYGRKIYKTGRTRDEIHKGQFIDGNRYGYGAYTYEDESTLLIEFKNNVPCGLGFLMQKGFAKLQQVMWEDGQMKWIKPYTVSEQVLQMFRGNKQPAIPNLDEFEVKHQQWRSHKWKQTINLIRSQRITDYNILAELEEEYNLMLKQIEQEKVYEQEIEKLSKTLQQNIDQVNTTQNASEAKWVDIQKNISQ